MIAESVASVAPSAGGEEPPGRSQGKDHTTVDIGPGARRLLLVEDNPGDVALISALLERSGEGPRLELTVAGHLAAALEELPRGIALVLLDLRLPDGAGVEVLRRIKGQAPDVPIVVLTGMEDSALARQCLEEGAQDYVRKDELPGHDLRRAIDFALARVRAAELAKRLEHADRLAAIGQLAAGVAHEVNNPAAFVQANSQEIDRQLSQCRALLSTMEQLPTGVLDMIDNVRAMAHDNLDGIERIVSIVRGLTVFARAKTASTAEPIDIGELCRTSSNLVLHQVRLRAEFVLDVGPTLTVVGDARKLGQVVVNLLINAAQAIAPGRAGANRVTLRTRTEGHTVVVSVTDTGRGIDPAHVEQIFKPFFSTKREGEGTGLGLSISKEIIEEHGGTLSVDSSSRHGSCFEIRLPGSTEATPEDTPRTPGTRKQPEPVRIRRRILLVDDEPQLLSALGRSLQRFHSVVEAPGGMEALAAIRDAGPFDVIICDLVMPGVDGIATLEMVGREFPELSKRFILLSGGAPTGAVARVVEDSNVTLLLKPIGARALLDAIDRVIGGRPE